MSKKPNPASKRGFTIIELLVVIGIITMLMGLIIPTVNILRENAKETQCANNMKQWMAALNQYADENKSVFPGDGLGENETWAWYEVLPPYIGLDPYSKQIGSGKAGDVPRVPRPGGGRSLFVCPSYPTTEVLPADLAAYTYSYGMNYWINAEKSAPELTKRMRLSQVKHPDAFIVFTETEDFNKKAVTLYPPNGKVSPPAFRHNKKVLCGFADGHVSPANSDLARTYQWNPHFLPGEETGQ